MKKIIVSLFVFYIFTTGNAQNITKIQVAGSVASTSTSSPILSGAYSYLPMILNPAGPISKDVEIHYSGLASGDSVVVWSDVTGLQGKYVGVSSSWFTIPRKSSSPSSFVNGQATYGFRVANSSDSLVFQFRFSSIPTGAVNIYVGIKRNGSSTLLGNKPTINFAGVNVFQSVRRSYKWTGAVDSIWQTAGNWEPTRSSTHDSDYIIFDNTNSQLVNVPYNAGQFTQTISKLLITPYTDVRFSNYTKSNGAQAKSTLKIQDLYNRPLYATDYCRLGFSGTDTLEIELQIGADCYFYANTIYTDNRFGKGGCLQLSSRSTFRT